MKNGDGIAEGSYVIPSVDRAFEVLERLTTEANGLTLAELARRTAIPKSTVFRILTTLEQRQAVVWDDRSQTFRLGHRLWLLGHSFLERSDLYGSAAPVMQRLAEASRETVFLGKLDDGEVIYLHRIESPRSVAVVKKLGQRAPAHCTATGTAILAFLPDAEVDAVIAQHGLDPYNDATVTDPAVFRARLRTVRSKGYAVVNGEYNRELMCVSAPVFDHTGRPKASLTVAMLAGQSPDAARRDEVGGLVRAAGLDLSRDLGYLGPRPS